ncbi:hypothetical protein DF156_22015 [Burkholderia ubonensis]|nr:hypothetical protein CJO71_11880 [Burkholderia ubonensis]RQP33159.1 hypothetical protein DF155_17975 [Burkholderia ubonensis]RQP37023.1 hypothetical protein DF156_22015 [Burkholderia ubonensis]RQP51728.1 hypothetical protein DF144_20620 [Burkholderia ubonensis]RQP55975.1 hypothetical protein DF151_21495 [Burkholderia ubonensis]
MLQARFSILVLLQVDKDAAGICSCASNAVACRELLKTTPAIFRAIVELRFCKPYEIWLMRDFYRYVYVPAVVLIMAGQAPYDCCQD